MGGGALLSFPDAISTCSLCDMSVVFIKTDLGYSSPAWLLQPVDMDIGSKQIKYYDERHGN